MKKKEVITIGEIVVITFCILFAVAVLVGYVKYNCGKKSQTTSTLSEEIASGIQSNMSVNTSSYASCDYTFERNMTPSKHVAAMITNYLTISEISKLSNCRLRCSINPEAFFDYTTSVNDFYSDNIRRIWVFGTQKDICTTEVEYYIPELHGNETWYKKEIRTIDEQCRDITYTLRCN